MHAPGALTARWTMGNGHTLTIHLNLGAHPVPLDARGTLLFATAPGLSQHLPAGHLVAMLAP